MSDNRWDKVMNSKRCMVYCGDDICDCGARSLEANPPTAETVEWNLGKPDMSVRCTCMTDCICWLHDDRMRGPLWNHQAYHEILRLQIQHDKLKEKCQTLLRYVQQRRYAGMEAVLYEIEVFLKREET